MIFPPVKRYAYDNDSSIFLPFYFSAAAPFYWTRRKAPYPFVQQSSKKKGGEKIKFRKKETAQVWEEVLHAYSVLVAATVSLNSTVCC